MQGSTNFDVTARTSRTAPALLSPEWHVLLCLATSSDVRIATIARRTGQHERAVARRIRALTDAGVIAGARVGRRNRYVIDPDAHIDGATHVTVGTLLKAFGIEL